jgi:GNAT superfamily N-acetyltransferase
VLVRPRTAEDVDECVRLLAAVHEQDGYPAYMGGSTFEEFLVTDDALATWVAVADSELVGHVALHRHTIPAAQTLASQALGRPIDELAVVARLLVGPEWRRSGAGQVLLDTATAEARRLGLAPMLDVCSLFTPAIAMYERHGWLRVGQVDLVFGDLEIAELVYVAPA